MKEKNRISIPLKYKDQIKSLCWVNNFLIDYVGGNVVISLDGKIQEQRVNFAYRFDSAVSTRNGSYSAIYERFGTKGLVLNRGKIVREINRSYYCAEAYEYPICFINLEGDNVGLIHCPREYNIIEIENATSGERLTENGREETDFFHSRLEVSPGQRWLLSAGWIWHPLDSIQLFDLSSGLGDPKRYTPFWDGNLGEIGLWEVNAATFIDDTKILLAGKGDEEQEDALEALGLVVFDLETKSVISRQELDKPAGMLMAAGSEHAVSFYENPVLLHLASGKVIHEWPDIPTDKRNSSISHHVLNSIIAADAENKRFAVATSNSIEVVTLG